MFYLIEAPGRRRTSFPEGVWKDFLACFHAEKLIISSNNAAHDLGAMLGRRKTLRFSV